MVVKEVDFSLYRPELVIGLGQVAGALIRGQSIRPNQQHLVELLRGCYPGRCKLFRIC